MPSYLALIPARWRKAFLGGVAACAAVAIILMTGGQPSRVETAPRVETSITAIQTIEPVPVVERPAPEPRAQRPETRKPAGTTARPVNTSRAKLGTANEPDQPVAAGLDSTESTKELALTPVARSAELSATAEAAPVVTAMAPTAAAVAPQLEASTIVGCLELDDDRFRLTNTEGEGAPRARSWRSGFLRRSNSRVDVIDASNGLGLSTHVGHRVSLTGALVDREMQARSLKMVAETCDD
jgi:hypothetical protein